MVRSILELTLATDRSSDQRCSVKSFLTNFAKLTGKHLCQCHFFNKVAGQRPATKARTKACKIYDLTAWSRNNYNTHIARYPLEAFIKPEFVLK